MHPSLSRNPVLAILLLLACAGLQAQPDGQPDPLTTSPCLAAQSEMALARAAVLAAPGARQPANRLAQARRNVGRICLGHSATSAPGSRTLQPPLRLAPPLQATPDANSAPPFAPAPAHAPESPAPAQVTACDPGGCWDSEGRRLERAVPLLLGPQGACTLQGTLLNCR